MSRGPTDDQASLVALADEVFAARTANEQLAKTELTATRVDDALWREAAQAGLVGAVVPEEHGGAGLGLEELCLLAEAQGRRLAPVPLVETSVAALVLTDHAPDDVAAHWLPRIAEGAAVLAVALRGDLTAGADGLTGTVGPVPQAHVADAVLVPVGDGLHLVEAAATERTAVALTDHSMAADLTLARTASTALADGGATRARTALRLALAAQLLGVADEGVREAARYTSEREQFGRPLATFQAVSQQLGDAYCDVQAMRATLWQAVWAAEHDPDAAERSAAAAVWWATEAGLRVQHVVQHVHGGIGADTTYPVHRRLLWTLRASAVLGGSGAALAELGEVLP